MIRVMRAQDTWLYERGDGRYKHRWNKDEAGFVLKNGAGVGKCHASIDENAATLLLRNGVVYNAPGTDEPEHVYAVYRGVIYEAAPTRPGVSFHGYPWSGNQGRPPLPPRILRDLKTRAEHEGYLREFAQWLKQHD